MSAPAESSKPKGQISPSTSPLEEASSMLDFHLCAPDIIQTLQQTYSGCYATQEAEIWERVHIYAIQVDRLERNKSPGANLEEYAEYHGTYNADRTGVFLHSPGQDKKADLEGFGLYVEPEWMEKWELFGIQSLFKYEMCVSDMLDNLE
ncbi:hypothetical protein N7468_009149 [Penicillium chermesinum]|uniref:Uncharacterized protein n=1 Tax=Penicillium chermesinum TaxID=63820 RepID=A0A9W9NH73_9EURO|nr:uncharacterized protein N7468_009149 [Penicillium chermesinum]KAJ5219945.1 hypothetical protein N7468_009149 [Penicillium chermesinum]KAJ6157404.1 hypothetical protein N7470_004996 [Penicillium chermesinum]